MRSATPQRGKSMASAGLIMGGASAAQSVLQLAVVAALARLLSPADFGLVAVSLLVADLANNLAQMGVGQALVRRKDIDAAYIRVTFTIALALGLFIAASVALLSHSLASVLGSPDSAPMIIAISVGIFVASASVTGQYILVRNLDAKSLAIRKLAGYVIGYGIVGVGGALAGLGAWSLVFAYLTDVIVRFILIMIRARHSIVPLFDATLSREIIGFGSGVSAGRIINAVAAQSDRAIVSILFGPASLGLYTRAYQIMRFPGQILGNAIDDIALPGFVRLGTDPQAIRRSIARAVSICSVLLLPTSAALCMASAEIVDVLLGDKWGAAATLLIILSAGIPFRPLQRIIVAALLAQDRAWMSSLLQAGGLFAFVMCALVGASIAGLNGAASGVTIGLILQLGILTAGCLKKDGAAWLAVARGFLSGIPLAIIVSAPIAAIKLIDAQLQIPSLTTLVAIGLACGACVATGILLAPKHLLGTEGRTIAQKFLAKLPARFRSTMPVELIMKRLS